MREDLNLLTIPEVAHLLDKKAATVREWMRDTEGFREAVTANMPGLVGYVALPKLARYVFGDDAATVIPEWRTRLAAYRASRSERRAS